MEARAHFAWLNRLWLEFAASSAGPARLRGYRNHERECAFCIVEPILVALNKRRIAQSANLWKVMRKDRSIFMMRKATTTEPFERTSDTFRTFLQLP